MVNPNDIETKAAAARTAKPVDPVNAADATGPQSTEDRDTLLSKLDNIWYLHKFKISVIFAIIITVVIVVSLNYTDFKPDIDIAYVSGGWTVTADNQAFASGGWYIDEEKSKELEECIALNIQDINNDKKQQVRIYPLGGTMAVEMDILADGCQIMLMNIDILADYMAVDSFEPLDEYIDKYGIDLSENPEVTTIVQGGSEEHTYAIPLEHMPCLLEAGFPPKEYYFTIRANKGNKKLAAKNENAYMLLDALLTGRQLR